VADYRGQVRQARDQFSNELDSVVPDVKISRRLDGTFVGHKQSSFADRKFALWNSLPSDMTTCRLVLWSV